MNTRAIKRPRVTRRREEARELFRSAVLDAAERAFAERGYHGARIQDIAEYARVGVGTVYNHFKEKEDVLRALLKERADALHLAMRTQPDDPPDFEGKLRASLSRALAYLSQHLHFFTVASEHGAMGLEAPGSDPILHRRERDLRFRRNIEALIEEGIAQKVLAPNDSRRLARFLGGILKGLLLGAIIDGRTDLTAELDPLLTFFLDGAAQGPRRARSSHG